MIRASKSLEPDAGRFGGFPLPGSRCRRFGRRRGSCPGAAAARMTEPARVGSQGSPEPRGQAAIAQHVDVDRVELDRPGHEVPPDPGVQVDTPRPGPAATVARMRSSRLPSRRKNSASEEVGAIWTPETRKIESALDAHTESTRDRVRPSARVREISPVRQVSSARGARDPASPVERDLPPLDVQLPQQQHARSSARAGAPGEGRAVPDLQAPDAQDGSRPADPGRCPPRHARRPAGDGCRASADRASGARRRVRPRS